MDTGERAQHLSRVGVQNQVALVGGDLFVFSLQASVELAEQHIGFFEIRLERQGLLEPFDRLFIPSGVAVKLRKQVMEIGLFRILLRSVSGVLNF